MRQTSVRFPLLKAVASLLVGCAVEPVTLAPPAPEATIAGLSLSCTGSRVELNACVPAEELRVAAIKSCAGELGGIEFEAACGSGGWRAARFDCCGADVDPAPAPVAGCFPVAARSEQCVPAADLVAAVRLQCGAGVLGGFVWGQGCKGSADRLEAQCCPPATPAPEDASHLPCLPVEVAEPNVCLEPRTLEAKARAACEASGRALGNVKFVGDCGGGTFFRARGSCCDTIVPVLPVGVSAGQCTTTLLGSPEDCRDAAAFQAEAAGRCAGQGLGLSQLEAFGACGDGATRYARFSCCGAARAPDSCVPVTLEGADYCAPPGVWALAAERGCAQVGRQFNGLTPGASCGEGVSASAVATCCDAPVPVDAPIADQCFQSHFVALECTSEFEWRKTSQLVCSQSGAIATAVEVGAGCGTGGFKAGVVTCCTSPVAEACEARSAWVPSQCIADEDGGTIAEAACAAEGRRAGSVKTACDAGGSLVSFPCCADAAN